ncbi:hypothetical protein ABZ656_33405 [Streptomyces sp. NPDC007095]|uniref:hypothetical protein n=1 Tax=Streptomyces sp. NPDC007095 TaxID=3154482 RepID=UPI0033D75AAB
MTRERRRRGRARPLNVGCTFVCHPDAADAVAQALRTAAEEVLEAFSDDEIFDYGVD